jgi:hypothetical protein
MNSVNTLNAIPPMLIANNISKKVMDNALFHPNSLTKTAIVAMHGM